MLWLEEEEKRLTLHLRSDQRKCARIVMMLFGQTCGSHRRPGCSSSVNTGASKLANMGFASFINPPA
ncbi:hypothetical protein EXN66_Car010251 [Channa argus]|uniref:Uncharacterized protein n=1 Tax=Channa argus TaxID=215402 RepID=A0A6G1PWC5_CHAAH|nr:hypothetical protein EXN66_Car010251 [Channa argus]